jgi:hypothetical protein
MFYKDSRKSVSIGIAITVLGASLTLLGCNSSKRSENARTTKQSSSAAANSTAPDIDLNCVINHIQNPPESFHYSFTDVSDNPWQEEAEVTPQSINGTFTNNSLPTPQSFHGTPQEVSSNLHAIGRMASLFALVRGNGASDGTETVNGYSTTKLSIDTARADATEQGLYKSTLGPGGWAKGTVWVTSQGCPVRIELDEELHSKDGSVSGKAHYEEAMLKK